ncbi:type IV pilus twitching motility protein PilT [soil metagenome]
MSLSDSVKLKEFIEIGYEINASDVFLKADQKPMMKHVSVMKPLPGDWPVLTAEDVKRLMTEMMSEKQIKRFEDNLEMDLAFQVPGKCRVRANFYMQRNSWATVCRIIPLKILTIEELGLPPVLNELTKHRLGLVLVTGPTGSGKTTTLAAMIDRINKDRACHIVTIEDPLEFVHQDKLAYVSQREVSIDTEDFQPALRAVLREAPDVILVGEMRDTTTMSTSMQAGETGHLVFSTVHTASAYETMDRIVNMFPPHEKHHLCQRMAGSLRAIVAQKIIPRADGQGRVAANEILICTPTVSKAIEDGHFSDLYGMMNEGQFWGMQTMNQALVRYVKAGIITEDIAMKNAGIASELKQMLRR